MLVLEDYIILPLARNHDEHALILENFPYAVRQLQTSSVALVSLVPCNHPQLLAPTFIEMTLQEQ